MKQRNLGIRMGRGWLHRLVRLLVCYPEWRHDYAVLKHPSGIELWIYHGWLHLEIWKPAGIRFTLWEKILLWPHVRRCVKRCVNEDEVRAAAIERDANMTIKELLDEA